MTRLMVLNSAELWEGEMRRVHVPNGDVVVLRLASGLVAYEDRCAHLGVPLSRGQLHGDQLTCMAHHYVFDAKTGCGLNPCGTSLKRVEVSENDQHIFVHVKAAP